jgi:LEA14-like dessication related protein
MKQRKPQTISHLSFILCFTAFLLIFSCCRDIKEVRCTGVKGVKVNKLDLSGINADVMLGIMNPNNFGFFIYRSKFDIVYNGVSLGTAKLSKRVRIGANAEKAYSFNLKSNFKNANLADVMKILGGGSQGNIEAKGDLKAGKFLLRKKFPIGIKEKVSLDR